MAAISASHRDPLEQPHTFAFATLGADGQPQVTAIWAMLDGDVIRTSLFKGRQKYENLVAHPQTRLRRRHPSSGDAAYWTSIDRLMKSQLPSGEKVMSVGTKPWLADRQPSTAAGCPR